MQFLLIAFFALVPVWQLSLPRVPVRSDPVLVRAVVNGNTITVTTVGRVRLLGITAPETGHAPATPAPFAQEARARLATLVLNRWVRLEFDERAGAYNPHSAYVMTEDGQFVNALLVRDGFARVSARAPLSRLEELKRAEREAEQARRGIWGGTPQIPPTRYTPPSDRPR